MIQSLMKRLGVTETQVQMAYYSGAIPKNIDPELFIKHWEKKLEEKRSRQR